MISSKAVEHSVTSFQVELVEPTDQTARKYTLAGVRPDMDAVPPDCPPELLQAGPGVLNL